MTLKLCLLVMHKIVKASCFAVVMLLIMVVRYPASSYAQEKAQDKAQEKAQESPREIAGDAPKDSPPVETIKYWGNKQSLKFHRPRCPFYRVMAEARRIPFHFRKDAISSGYMPCNYCLPQTWTTVRATFYTSKPEAP
jgi:hypothetical protein